MIIATNGEASSEAGELHYPVELEFEWRKDEPGYWIKLFMPETYHKSVVEFGPLNSFEETNKLLDPKYLRDNWRQYSVLDYSGSFSLSEVIRDVLTPLVVAGSEPVIRYQGLLGNYDRIIAEHRSSI